MCSMLTFIARKGSAVLWSWGNYRYTIDVDGVQKVVMEDTDLEDALKRLQEISSAHSDDDQSPMSSAG